MRQITSFNLLSQKEYLSKLSHLKKSWFRNYFENSDSMISDEDLRLNKFFPWVLAKY